MPYQRILVALACKEDERRVIHEVMRLAYELNSKVTVLHISDPSIEEQAKSDSGDLISENEIRHLFRRCGYEKEADEIEVNIIFGSSYPKEIARATLTMDLLVIGYRKKHGFLTAYIDSINKKIAEWVSCPTLIVPINI